MNCATLLERLEHDLSQAETEMLLAGDNDQRNAICTIHPGAGGTESQDWAEMLLRMYLKWAERRGFKTEIIDYQPGEEAGIKSVTFQSRRRICLRAAGRRSRRAPPGPHLSF